MPSDKDRINKSYGSHSRDYKPDSLSYFEMKRKEDKEWIDMMSPKFDKSSNAEVPTIPSSCAMVLVSLLFGSILGIGAYALFESTFLGFVFVIPGSIGYYLLATKTKK